jgi:hypothetical protein
MGADAAHDRGVVTSEDARDLWVAVAPLGVLADQAPKLVPGGCDGAGALAAADLDGGHTAASAHLPDQIEQASQREVVKDERREARRSRLDAPGGASMCQRRSSRRLGAREK